MHNLLAILVLLAVVLIVTLAVLSRTVLTSRAWWLLVCLLCILGLGLFTRHLLFIQLGLTLVLWLSAEWLLFALRSHLVLPRLRVRREIHDKRGLVRTLWSGQSFRVRVQLELSEDATGLLDKVGLLLALPYVTCADRVPFSVELLDPDVTNETPLGPGSDGPLGVSQPLTLEYSIRCGPVGQARFEGVSIQLADLQGFFSHSTFIHAPVQLRILPRLIEYDSPLLTNKRSNQLPPPGVHRLRRPGSGSELLDLRDYLPGDPPRTIAWKVSARRDRLVTKEFESSVPIRCTLLVDTSVSVRVPSRQGKPLHRLIEIAAAILQYNASVRDLTGLCLFDEQSCNSVRPDRSTSHVTRLLHLLTDAGCLTPASRHVEPERLLPLAYAFAEEVYPELVRPPCNSMPFWQYWVASSPGSWRRRELDTSLLQRLLRYLHRRKVDFLWLGTTLVPLGMLLLNYLAGYLLSPQDRERLSFVTTLLGVLFLIGCVGLVVLTLLTTGSQRRLAAWRKRLAALLSLRYGLAPGGLSALLEDDDLFVLQVQRFLADHQVPYSLPLYDIQGRYLYSAPEKIAVLSKALVQAVGRGRDNELFVLLADVLELDEHLEPLLRAVRVALGRHHQVILVCPWPAGIELPDEKEHPSEEEPPPITGAREGLRRQLSQATTLAYHGAYQRVRRRFAALGVTVVCAASDKAIPLILQRIDRLRSVRRMV